MSSSSKKPLLLPLFAESVRQEWPWSRLDDVADVYDCPHSTPALVDDPSAPFVVRSQDVRSGSFLTANAARVSPETYVDRIKRVEPRYGDLVYSREGTYFGIAAEVPRGIKACLGQRMVLIRPDAEKLDHSFLKYWLNSPLVFGHIHGFRDGTVAERLNLPVIRGLPVAIPSLSEQREMARALSALDDRITLLRETNATLEAIAQALFKSWFVDFDPVRAKMEGRTPEGLDEATAALFPDRFEESKLGLVPRGWRVANIGSIAEVIDCLHAKKPDLLESGRPFLQLNNIRDDGLLDIGKLACISEQDYQKWISRIEVSGGDCVITNVGRVGSVSQVPVGFKAAMGRNMTAIRLKPEWLYPTYLIELLQSPWMKLEIDCKTDVGTILNALNVKNIPKLRCVLATTDVMSAFESVSRPLRASMEKNLERSQTLATLRDTLLPRLISGQLRLPETEAMIEEISP